MEITLSNNSFVCVTIILYDIMSANPYDNEMIIIHHVNGYYAQ